VQQSITDAPDIATLGARGKRVANAKRRVRRSYKVSSLFLLYIDSYVKIVVPVWDQKEFVMKNLMASFLNDETAATAIEYGLIAAGISVAIIAVVNGLGTKLSATFSSISSQLK
jgi:pilus assembly protein Flp/PilA